MLGNGKEDKQIQLGIQSTPEWEGIVHNYIDIWLEQCLAYSE